MCWVRPPLVCNYQLLSGAPGNALKDKRVKFPHGLHVIDISSTTGRCAVRFIPYIQTQHNLLGAYNVNLEIIAKSEPIFV